MAREHGECVNAAGKGGKASCDCFTAALLLLAYLVAGIV